MTGITEVSFSIVYAITMIVALAGNTLLIYIVWKKPGTRNLTSFMFVNMAVADLLVAVFQMPISIAIFYFHHIQIPCEFFYYSAFVSTTASIFCLAVMAFDRYFAVVHPFRSSIWFRKPKIITPVLWISSMVLMSIVPVSYKPVNGVCFLYDTVLSHLAFWSFILVIDYLLPLAVISSLYIIVAGKLWLHEMPADDEVPVHQRQQEIPKKKVIRMLIIVVVVFAVCWLPVHVYQMDKSVKRGALWPPSLIYFCYWLSQANSAINPWLYIGLNGKMKAAFTKMIRCCRGGNLRQQRSSVGTNTRSKATFTKRSLLDTKM
ncbi:tachykinin-like peptides receptor 86C [Orbicella faveolata]|uniref:tachykinin-like peptides receptor 86C n=1 Tax=Orbicella faveolata TaxID=48498 RepID=UPI0009E23A8F|nr:tachykinin-like peptides receptor 86C [Orbicella faveolata]